MPPKFGGADKCEICKQPVYVAERIEAGNKPYHKLCFKCHDCKMTLNLGSYKQAHGILYCNKHYQAQIVAKNTQTPVL